MGERARRVIHTPRRFTEFEWGGTETVVIEVAKSQKARGLRPEIVTSLALDSRRQSEYQGIPVKRFQHVYPYLGLSKDEKLALDKKGGNLISFPLLNYLLFQKDIRIFHSHVLKRLAGTVRTAAKIKKKPYVVTLHGGAFDVPQSEVDQMLAPVQGKNKLEWGKAIGAVLGSRKVLNDADWILCVGHNEMEKAKESLSHNRISCLPNGVDDKKFRSGSNEEFRNKYNISKDEFVILCVGRIDFQKNQKLLIEAFSRLHKLNQNSTLVLMGPVTQSQYCKELEQLAQNSGAGHKIKFIKGVSNESNDLVNAYHAANLCVLPSIHEPFGIVVLEAWAAGKPVIASRCGGLKTLIRDEVNGLLIDPFQSEAPDELFRKILYIQQNKDYSHLLGENGRAEVMQKYRWSAIDTQLEEIYLQAEENNLSKQSGRFYTKTQEELA